MPENGRLPRPAPPDVLWGRAFGAVAGHRALVSSSSALVAQTAVMGATGALFWLLATRLYPAAVVGEAAGLFTLVIVGDYVSALGLPIVIARYASGRDPDATSIFTVGLILTSITSAITAGVIIAMASSSFAAPLLAHGPVVGWILVFVAINGLSYATLLDNRLLGLGFERSFLIRHMIFAVGRLLVIAMPLVGPDALWIWMCTTLGALPLAIAAFAVHRRDLGPFRIGPVDWRGPIRYGAVNMVSALLATAPFTVLPLVVFALVDPEDNAAFHIAWSFAAIAFLVPALIERALLITSSGTSASIGAQARASLGLSTLAAAVIIAAAAPALLVMPWVYGPDYERSGVFLLVLLAGLLPYGLTTTALGTARILGDTPGTLFVSTVLAAAVLVPGMVGTRSAGTTGAATGWVLGHAFAGLVSALWLARRLATAPRSSATRE